MTRREATAIERHECRCKALVVTASRFRLVALLGTEGGIECICGRILTLSRRGRPIWIDPPALRAALRTLARF